MVRFFSALLFSDPQSLGWDLTVASVSLASGCPQYEFVVEDADGTQTRYRSLDLITSSHNEPINGKGTRVWRVVELRDGEPYGDPVVLKDVWRHGELAQEGSVIKSIRDLDLSHDERVLIDEHLPTVLHHGDVVIHPTASNGVAYLDSTQTHIRNFYTLCVGMPVDGPLLFPPGTRLGPYFGSGPSRDRREIRGRMIHYRIVFKEHCTPIRHEKSPSVVLNMLAGICEGACDQIFLYYATDTSRSDTSPARAWLDTP